MAWHWSCWGGVVETARRRCFSEQEDFHDRGLPRGGGSIKGTLLPALAGLGMISNSNFQLYTNLLAARYTYDLYT